MGVAFYPGSFDPFHLGHLDIVEQAVGMFGELVIGVMHNPAKPSGMFTADERADLIRQSTTHLGKAVCVEKFSGLTVDAAASITASFIVKSARTTSDFETEQQMAQTNRAATGIDTVLLFSSPEHQFITSTYIRQFAQHKGTMRTKVAPQCVLEALAKKNS
ncbi:MAG: pantetheine-phosphate adenylyltransferase [Ilumatobacteraceae bacterium]